MRRGSAGGRSSQDGPVTHRRGSRVQREGSDADLTSVPTLEPSRWLLGEGASALGPGDMFMSQKSELYLELFLVSVNLF